MERPMVTIDGNEAAAYVAHQVNDVIAIYPITPSSPMGELADAYAAGGKPNIWGTVPLVMEMQSEVVRRALCTATSRRMPENEAWWLSRPARRMF